MTISPSTLDPAAQSGGYGKFGTAFVAACLAPVIIKFIKLNYPQIPLDEQTDEFIQGGLTAFLVWLTPHNVIAFIKSLVNQWRTT